MQFSMKSLAAIGVLAALASAPALAVEDANTGNSSLFITVYDTTLGASVVQDLGLNYADFLEATVTPEAGLTLDFNVNLSHFTSVGSNPANLRYTIFAGDATGGATGTGVMVTAALTQGVIPGINGDVVGMLGSSGVANVFASWQANCAGGVTCNGTSFGNTYFGGNNWGDRFANQLDVSGSGAIGEALGFYFLTRSGATAGGPLNSVQYANSQNLASWLLNADGTLRYSIAAVSTAPVPLPAAAWLLFSGLAGLGVVGRRKAAVKA